MQRRPAFGRLWTRHFGQHVTPVIMFGYAPKTTGALSRGFRKRIWNHFYGPRASANCILCTHPLDRDTIDYHLAHVVSVVQGGHNGYMSNRVPMCGTCNVKGDRRRENMFVQLVVDGLCFRIPVIFDHLIQLYCEEFWHCDYTFASRLDFVQRVYGAPSDVGGVTEPDVFDVLQHADNHLALNEYQRNPHKWFIHNIPVI